MEEIESRELRKHIGPLVEKEKHPRQIFRRLGSAITIVWHGIVPHKHAKEAEKVVTGSYFSTATDLDIVYSTAIEMYKESKERIQHLEEKAFKLLTYISAVSAILFYFLGTELNGTMSIFVTISIALLVVAMIVSLRCIGTKEQKAIFLDTIIDFKDPDKPKSKDKSEVIAEITNCTVYNQTVADNTADILKASSHILSFGIVTTIIAFILFFSLPAVQREPTRVSVIMSDSTLSESIKKATGSNQVNIEEINLALKKIADLEYQKKIQLDSLNRILNEINSSAALKKKLPK